MQTQVCAYAGACACVWLHAMCACSYVHTCMLCVCGGRTQVCLCGALALGLTCDPGWKGQENQGGWVGLGLLSYTKALLLPALGASWLVQLPFIHTGSRGPESGVWPWLTQQVRSRTGARKLVS